MLTKGFRKAILVLSIVVLTVSAARAAPKDSVLVSAGTQKGDVSFEREIEGGLKITLQEAYKKDNSVQVRYVILSEEDVIIKVDVENDNGALFDDRGHQLLSSMSYYWQGIEIGNQKVSEREIIGGIRTEIFVKYNVGQDYVMPKKFARAAININGKKLVFRDVPVKQ
jgi:hypothetical protein